MRTFRIYSKAGVDYGSWEGETPAAALAAMHRDAGYAVTCVGGDLQFPDDQTRELCGDAADWIIEAEETDDPDALYCEGCGAGPLSQEEAEKCRPVDGTMFCPKCADASDGRERLPDAAVAKERTDA